MLNIYQDTESLIAAAATYFIEKAKEAIAERDQFTVSLSGGSSPKKLYELLAKNYAGDIDWKKVFFFFGDERFVPSNHPDSNALMAKTAIFDPLKIDTNQVFNINTTMVPSESAIAYQQTIFTFFKTKKPVFDLVLLGLGDDAHTASLFPGTFIVHEIDDMVKEVYLKDKDTYRISMTDPLINNARNIAFLTYGSSKAAAVKHVLEGKKDIEKYPAQLIKPKKGKLTWFIDEAAAADLEKKL